MLDSYEDDRKPNMQGWTDYSREIGLPCIVMDKEAAAGRDSSCSRCSRTRRSCRPSPCRRDRSRSPVGRPGSGTVAVQGKVRSQAGEGLLDDIAGRGFQFITTDPEVVDALTAADRVVLESIGASVIVIGAPGSGAPYEDVNGTYADWFDSLGRVAVIARPDYYLFGSAESRDDVHDLVDALTSARGARSRRRQEDECRSRRPTPPWKAEAEAHKRAMPLQRLTGNGMDYADVIELYRTVDDGVGWSGAAERLGDRNRQRADEPRRRPPHHRRQLVPRRSACYRVGQVPLPGLRPAKLRMYRRPIDATVTPAHLDNPPIEHVEVPWGGAALCGWLLAPDTGTEQPPTVIVMGGFDGWREEYHVGATYLVQRGIAVLLIDGPGQGETRLFHGLLGSRVDGAFSALIDHLIADERLSDTVAIWGNSMGGFLAALVATRDPRIAACVVNGGTNRPAEILDRFHRFTAKIQPLLGIDDPDVAARP